MTEAFSRKTLASLIPRQIMLGTAFSKEDSIKESKGKKMDETMAVMGIEDMEKKKKKKEKNSSFKMSNTVGMCPELADTRAIDYPNGDVLPWKGNGRDDLLRSIDAFLESSGFVKTLSVFRSEAQIEVTKRGSFINLEDLFEKSSWPSKRDSVANIEWSKEQDTGKLIPEVTDDLDVKTKKKKRKVKEAFGSSELENAEKNHLGAALLTTQLSRKLMKKEKHSGEDESGPRSGAKAQEVLGQVRGSKRDLVANIEWTKERDAVDDSDVKTKDKKRKINQVFGSFELGNAKKSSMGAPLRPEDSDFQNFLVNKDTALDEKDASKENFDELKNLNNNPIIGIDSAVINKSGKNRKKKEAKQPLEQFRQGGSQEAFAKEPDDGKSFASTKHQESVNSDNMANEFHKNVGNFKKAKRKTKKKMEEVTTAYSLHTDSSDKLVDETCGGVEKLDNGSLQKIDFVKDSIAVSKENASDGEATTNKKKKRSSTKETEKHFEITASNSKHAKLEVTKGEKVITDQKILYCNESLPLKQKSNEPSKELFICLDKHEENSALQDSLEQLNGFHSGNVIIEKHANEGSAMPNSMKKERHSGEQRGLNAFQRVKVDEIKFADERLQDNSYWALDETGSGYGAKAQEVLGQVRGRNFRHEKTKKKRGTYRGGQIDLESHSIKFNYSDDD